MIQTKTNGFAPIHCVFSTDKAYCPHLGVAIASLLDSNGGNNLVLHVIHHDVGEENLSRFRQIVDRSGAPTHFYNFKADEYSHFYTSGYISLASYFRLFLTDILPPDIEKIVYIDADIVVRDNIAPLAATPYDTSIAAIADPFPGDSVARLGLPASHVYFNAGVLLINLARWRASNQRDRFLSFVEEQHARLQFHDQDALNALLHDDVTYLDMRWNFQPRANAAQLARIGVTPSQYEAMAANPAIVHLTSFRKPWLYKYDIPFEAEYLRSRGTTPWSGFVQPDKTPLNRMRRIVQRKAPAVLRVLDGIAWRMRRIAPRSTAEAPATT